MSFCKKCGNQLHDGAQFCPQCGEPVGQINPGPDYNGGYAGPSDTGFRQGYAGPQPVKKSRKPLFIVIGFAVAAAAAVIVLLLVLRGGNSHTTPVEVTLDAMTSDRISRSSAQDILDQLPDPMIDYILDSYDSYMTESDLVDLMADELGPISDSLNAYDLSYEILESTQLDIVEILDLEDEYAAMDINMKIDDAYTVEVLLRGEYEGETYREIAELITIQVDGTWYLDYSSFNRLF